MPGTPEQRTPEEPFFLYANRKAMEIAGQQFHPIGQAQQYHRMYWIVMSGYGYRPYYSGCSLY